MQNRFSRFQILEIPASGTFGVVCIARDPQGATYAIKVLRMERGGDRSALQRARDEARLLSRLEHPNLVRVEPVLQINGRPCILMEYVEGVPLSRLLHAHPKGLPAVEVLAILRDAARGLDAAWTSQSTEDGEPMRVVHRDIKPGNLMIDITGRVRVVDFGLAKATFADREARSAAFVPGSRGYMAPERYDGDDSPKGDVYALGLTLIELLSGHKPVLSIRMDRHDDMALAAWIKQTETLDLDLDADMLRDLFLDLCAYEPSQRPFPAEVATRIEAILSTAGRAPDLETFAEQVVRPVHESRTLSPASDHPRYQELSFLEEELGEEGVGFDPAVEVKRFVDSPDFPVRAGEVAALLTAHPATDVRPLIRLLDNASAPPWQFWRSPPPREHTLAALKALVPVINPPILDRARKLTRHKDRDISRAAKELLEQSYVPR